MSGADWLSVADVAARLGRSEQAIRARCRVRDRRDSIPDHLLDASGHSYRIHRSYVERTAVPIAPPTNVRELRPTDERIQRLLDANKALRAELLEAQIQLATVQAALAEEREQREVLSA